MHAAELVILAMPDLGPLHVGGAIRFGPDGMLYLGLGDNNNEDNAQNLASRHGKIIRIDVRGATAEQPYRIPDDNPFATTPGASPEVWAYGLRHPWRMDFDAAGNLWVADVGDLSMEEVSVATAGANLGWPLFEGTLCVQAAEECAAVAGATAAAGCLYPQRGPGDYRRHRQPPSGDRVHFRRLFQPADLGPGARFRRLFQPTDRVTGGRCRRRCGLAEA